MRLPVRQLTIAAAIAVLVLVGLSFARVFIVAYQLNLQKQALEDEVRRLQSQNQDLQRQIEYLQTDTAIEKLARQELGWTRPGDTAVVVVQATTATPPDRTPVATVTPTPRSAWERFWNAVAGGGGSVQSGDRLGQ